MDAVTILIPTLGTRVTELERLFESLTRQTNRNFNVVIVSQDNYDSVDKICKKYEKYMKINHIFSQKKGLSVARNRGLKYINGIVWLSDDDCWYPENAVEIVLSNFLDTNCDILLTQIYDWDQKKIYKKYLGCQRFLKYKFELMSRSSIEIAFNTDKVNLLFDEALGLGTENVCGEEVDFLLNNSNRKILYVPRITVYHAKKCSFERKKVVAKGYLYAKHFNILVGFAVCMRDLLLKREYNFNEFFQGFYLYKRLGKR